MYTLGTLATLFDDLRVSFYVLSADLLETADCLARLLPLS